MSVKVQKIEPIVIQDTREQTPWKIANYPVEIAKLDVGDYGIQGLSDWEHPEFIVERKSLDDLVGSLVDESKRFWKEVKKMRQFQFAALLIEAPYEAAAEHAYRSRMNPKSVLGMVDVIQVRLGIHVIWCGDHQRAACRFESLVRQKVRGYEKDFKRLVGRKEAA